MTSNPDLVFLIGPSGIGKSTAVKKLDSRLTRWKGVSLDLLAAQAGIRLGLLDTPNASMLLGRVGRDEFFRIGFEALDDLVRNDEDDCSYLIDVGAGFQGIAAFSNIFRHFPVICLTANESAAYDRCRRSRPQDRDLEGYREMEFSDARKKVYGLASRTIDTSDQSPDETMQALMGALEKISSGSPGGEFCRESFSTYALLKKNGKPNSSISSSGEESGISNKGGDSMKYLDFDTYETIAKANPGPHWDSYMGRWPYFRRAAEIAQTIHLNGPKSVLEMGTMGVSVVADCNTIDYADNWDFRGKAPTYLWDARNAPWPIPDKKYSLFIALRVFQHLAPVQRQCFEEAKRIADNVLIVVPSEYNNDTGITEEMFTSWNDNTRPTIVENVAGRTTFLYLWRPEDIR